VVADRPEEEEAEVKSELLKKWRPIERTKADDETTIRDKAKL
jgi:hypothetical protein